MKYEGEKIGVLSFMVEKARIKVAEKASKLVEAQKELDRLEKALKAKKNRSEGKNNGLEV